MLRIALRHGLFAGLVLAALLLGTAPFQGVIPPWLGMVIGYAGMVGAFVFAFAAVRRARERAGGMLPFRHALGVSLLVVLVGSVCYTLTWEVLYFSRYRVSYMATYEARMVESARASGATAAEIERQRAELRAFAVKYDQPLFNAAITMLEPMPVALVMALAAAAFGRRRRTADAGTESALARA
ncbi:MAG: DUF4199 family protein [Gemmatimonadaceae bacterium]|nr:DUF4199 family protein [Gemmatimonadaceae bacterium]